VTTNPSSGHLIIRVLEAKNLFLPQGAPLPPPIEKALASGPAAMASSPPAAGGRNRESLQRKQCWWLPYVLLEFDKNEVLIDALGGGISEPVWMYKATLSVSKAFPFCVYMMLTSSFYQKSDVSRASEITVSAYLRTSQTAPGHGRNDMGNDLFLGGVKVTPVFDSKVIISGGGDVSCGLLSNNELALAFNRSMV
jgi:serum/glucocorticoid-regulated kinase 2